MIEIVKTNHRDGWIPITEQEPPENHVLVTLKHSEDDYEVCEIDYGIVKHQVRENRTFDEFKRANNIMKKTIAWMPMPEPYKED